MATNQTKGSPVTEGLSPYLSAEDMRFASIDLSTEYQVIAHQREDERAQRVEVGSQASRARGPA